MPSPSNIFQKYPNNYFVETGSGGGEGIQRAISAGFQKIISIELSEKYFNICKKKFESNENVEIVLGDSSIVLSSIILSINQPITFWLDGHHSCGDTALGKYWSPLMIELEQIGNHSSKNHTILIDDLRCWNVNNPVIRFGEKEIKESILKINEKYTFVYEDGHVPNDILVARVRTG